MKKYRVRVFEEDINVKGAVTHNITEHGWLQFSNNESVFATFREWTFFFEVD